jgi:hypothetical protein
MSGIVKIGVDERMQTSCMMVFGERAAFVLLRLWSSWLLDTIDTLHGEASLADELYYFSMHYTSTIRLLP